MYIIEQNSTENFDVRVSKVDNSILKFQDFYWKTPRILDWRAQNSLDFY